MIKLKLKFFKRREPFYMDWDKYQELINALDDINLLRVSSGEKKH